MKCLYCGEEMLPIDKFCNNCGAANPNSANNGPHPRIPGPQAGNGYSQPNRQYGQNYNGYGQYNGQYGQNYNGYGQYNGQYSGGGNVDPEMASRVSSGELISPAYVTIGDAVKLFFKNYTNFSGRSTRSEYWYMIVFNMIVNMAISFIAAFISFGSGDSAVGTILSSIYSLIVFIPGLAIIVRRLHDIGKSGWWYLLIFTCVGAFVLLYWFAQPSGSANKWGPSANDLYGGQGYGNGGHGNFNNYNRY